MENLKPDSEQWSRALIREYPELPEILGGAGDAGLYVVGGAVRDLLCGRGRTDLDLVTEGDPAEIAARLGGDRSHSRFMTASARVGALQVDIARARTETYPYPGSLPRVAPADIEQDLARRDFTINAMAVPVRLDAAEGLVAGDLLDPFGGRVDLAEGVLRLLHEGSITDDPTRILRGARYAAGYGLIPDPASELQLRGGDLGTVSRDRIEADLERIARDPEVAEAFSLLERWRALPLQPGWRSALKGIAALAPTPPWKGRVDPVRARLLATVGPPGCERHLIEADPQPQTPSEAVALAAGCPPERLLLAAAAGCDWVEQYLQRWSRIRLEIGGEDLLAAGIDQGPAIGRALKRVLQAKQDGQVTGRRAELEMALALAREEPGALG